jgi:hypothetical protein
MNSNYTAGKFQAKYSWYCDLKIFAVTEKII